MTAALKVSDEGDKRRLMLGRTLKHMLNDIADGGKETTHDDYLIA
jgi:hypothetical protein